MVSAIALVTGVSAVSVGSLLLRTWLRHGGALAQWNMLWKAAQFRRRLVLPLGELLA